MSTINGFGTCYLGWRHRPDGTAEATRWVVALFMPLVPLARHHLRLIHDPDREPALPSAFVGLAGLSGAAYLHGEVSVIEILPLSWRQVGITYLRAYVGLPLLLAVPLALAMLATWAIQRYGPDDSSQHATPLRAAPILLWFAYVLVVGATLIHRIRGGRR